MQQDPIAPPPKPPPSLVPTGDVQKVQVVNWPASPAAAELSGYAARYQTLPYTPPDYSIEVITDKPSLFRLERLYNSAGALILADTFTNVELVAAPYSDPAWEHWSTSPFSVNLRRGMGPYVYLPFAGRWRVGLLITISITAGIVPSALAYSLIPGDGAESVIAQMSGLLPGTKFVDTQTLAAATAAGIPRAAALLSYQSRYFGLTFLRITNTGANAAVIAVGDLPVVAPQRGQLLAPAGELFLRWETLAGRSVSGISTLGTTLDISGRMI